MKTQCNNFIFKKIDSVRTIRPSCNYVYFVYYYMDVCDSTLTYIFLQNIDPHRSLSSSQLKLSEKVNKDNYAIDHYQ